LSASTGTTLTVNFSRAFESVPAVTLSSPHLFPTNITATGFQVTVPPFGIVVDNSANTVGRYLSMAVVNGNPAIAYYDETSGDLKYCRSLTTNGAIWGAPVVAHVGGANLVGKFPSLTIVNGRPAVAYYDDTADDLKYVRAADANGTTWGAPITVASTGTIGLYAQLNVANGRPAIAYYNSSSNRLEFVRAGNVDGTAWGLPVAIDGSSTNVAGEYCSMEIVGGNPAIAYRAATADVLRYCRAADADGTAWSAPVEINNLPGAGEDVSLTIVSGRPAVAFLARGSEVLFERAGDANGTNWTSTGTVVGGARDSATPSGIALRVVAGLPRIAYWHAQVGNVFYVESTGANGSGWKLPNRIFGNTGTAGGTVGLLDLNGTPVLAAPSFGSGLDLFFYTAAVIPDSYTAREVVKIEATSVAAGSITREMLAPGVFGNATITGDNALAIGTGSSALNEDAFATGYFSLASGWASFAGGFACTASGIGAIALGQNAQSLAFSSVALGDNAIADRQGQVAVGRYNRPEANALFIVGNGFSSGRNNALWVETDGDLEISGANARKPGGGSWATPSDARLKNVQGSFARGLEALRRINPVCYQYKSGNPKKLPSEPRFVGVVAQEVESAIPEAVTRDEQGYRMVNNDPILWTMLNAIKELEARLPDSRNQARERDQLSAMETDRVTLDKLNTLVQAKDARIVALERTVAELKEAMAKFADKP
jgi:hypothetical protein